MKDLRADLETLASPEIVARCVVSACHIGSASLIRAFEPILALEPVHEASWYAMHVSLPLLFCRAMISEALREELCLRVRGLVEHSVLGHELAHHQVLGNLLDRCGPSSVAPTRSCFCGQRCSGGQRDTPHSVCRNDVANLEQVERTASLLDDDPVLLSWNTDAILMGGCERLARYFTSRAASSPLAASSSFVCVVQTVIARDCSRARLQTLRALALLIERTPPTIAAQIAAYTRTFAGLLLDAILLRPCDCHDAALAAILKDFTQCGPWKSVKESLMACGGFPAFQTRIIGHSDIHFSEAVRDRRFWTNTLVRSLVRHFLADDSAATALAFSSAVERCTSDATGAGTAVALLDACHTMRSKVFGSKRTDLGKVESCVPKLVEKVFTEGCPCYKERVVLLLMSWLSEERLDAAIAQTVAGLLPHNCACLQSTLIL